MSAHCWSLRAWEFVGHWALVIFWAVGHWALVFPWHFFWPFALGHSKMGINRYQRPKMGQILSSKPPRARDEYDLEERTALFGEAVIVFAKTVPVTPITREILRAANPLRDEYWSQLL